MQIFRVIVEQRKGDNTLKKNRLLVPEDDANT